MSEYKIRDENNYRIDGWMINRLQLKGTELILYAIIYGFTQDGKSEFFGGWEYLSAFAGGISKPTIINTLDALVAKGYITKRKELINRVWYPRYKAVLPIPDSCSATSKEILPVPVKKLNQTSKEILPATIYNNNNIDIKKGVEISPLTPTDIVKLYHEICPSLNAVKRITESRKQAIEDITGTYSTEDIRHCFELAEASAFLTGHNEREWKATFDWLINPDNMAKVLEGNFVNNNGDRAQSFDVDEFFEAAVKRSMGSMVGSTEKT